MEEKESKVVELNAVESKKRELFVVESEKEVSLRKIEADKEIFIKNQEKEQESLDAKKVTTQKQAEVMLEQQRAEEIVSAKVESEKKIVEQNAELVMEEKKADNDLKIAEKKAQAKITEAEANAKAIKLEAEALALKEALPILEKAKAEKALMDVYNSSDCLIQLKMIEVLPELAKYQVEAVKNIKIDSINVISGGDGSNAGAVGNEIGSTVNNIIKSIPAFKMANDISKSINLPTLDLTTVNEKDINVENM